MRNSEKLYSHLYMKDVTDADYTQITKRIFKDFKVKKKENIMICLFKTIHDC